MNNKIAATLIGSIMMLCFGVMIIDVAPITGAATITVDDSGGADFPSIQKAIDAANPGDSVFVYNGLYFENITINKTIDLDGESRTDTIIDGGGWDDVVYISSDWVNITGFTINNSGNSWWNDAAVELYWGLAMANFDKSSYLKFSKFRISSF